jgi:hypothetical protein
MKKLLLAGLLSVLTVSVNAGSWNYNLSKNDFDGDTRSATIKPDGSEIELAIVKSKDSDTDTPYIGVFLLPLGVLTADCKLCEARVIADGKEAEPVKLLAASSYKTYFLYESSNEAFMDILRNNKVVKIQLPTSRNRQNVKETLTFTQSEVLSLEKLDSAK